MSIPDIPTVPEVSGESNSGLKYHIMGTIQQTLAVDLTPGRVIFSDAGAMSWMTARVTMDTHSGGGLGGMVKRAFICAEKSVSLDIALTKKFGAGLFGGTGFILQRLTGPGMVFAELDGDAIEYHLKPGEKLRIEPGHVAMFESSVSFDTEMIRGLANILAGGEGLFLATLTGPGRIWLHSMTVSKMAERLAISTKK